MNPYYFCGTMVCRKGRCSMYSQQWAKTMAGHFKTVTAAKLPDAWIGANLACDVGRGRWRRLPSLDRKKGGKKTEKQLHF